MKESRKPLHFASKLVKHWRDSVSDPSALAILADNPNFWNDRSFVVDIAYAEYCLRLERGECLAVEEFCERFAPFQQLVNRQIQIHCCLQELLNGYTPTLPDVWPLPGDDFDHFQLIEELGRGGIAHVYLAEDTTLANRRVVLKASPRLTGEAERLVRFDHGGISPIHSIAKSQVGDFTAICMPFLSRTTLADFLAARNSESPETPFEETLKGVWTKGDPICKPNLSPPVAYSSYWESVLRFSYLLVDALDHAHSRGILHLDLKPSNILVQSDGCPVLIDFNLSTEMQRVDLVGGTLPYMAPEQLRFLGSEFESKPPLDVRTDFYSFGMVLYELATGVHPICPRAGETDESRWEVEELLDSQNFLSRTAEAFDDIPDVGLRKIVRKCLRLEPQDRFQDASSLKQAIASQLKLSRRAVRFSKRYPRRAFLGALGIVSSATATGVIAQLLTPDPARQAFAAYDRGDYAKCIDLMPLIAEQVPDADHLIAFRALVRLKQGYTSEARRAFIQTYKQSNDPRLLVMAASCCVSERNYEVAASYYKWAIEKKYTTPMVYNALGHCYASLRRFRDAEIAYTHAIAMDSKFGAALCNRMQNEIQWALAEHRPVADVSLDDIELAKQALPHEAGVPYLGASMIALAELPAEEKAARVRSYLNEAQQKGIQFRVDPIQASQNGAYSDSPFDDVFIPPVDQSFNESFGNHRFEILSVEELLGLAN